jgi:hypothetical protein
MPSELDESDVSWQDVHLHAAAEPDHEVLGLTHRAIIDDDIEMQGKLAETKLVEN